MQYRRHNFLFNLISASQSDIEAAWEPLVSEVNELALDAKYRPALAAMLAKNGVSTGANPTANQVAGWTVKGIFEKEAIRAGVIDAIAIRHKDPFFEAPQGQFDKINGLGAINNDAAVKALGAMVKDTDMPLAAVKKLQAFDLANKQRQRGISVSIIDRMRNTPVKTAIGILLFATGVYVVGKYAASKASATAN